MSASLPLPRLSAQFEGPAILPGLAIDNSARDFANMRHALRVIWARAFYGDRQPPVYPF